MDSVIKHESGLLLRTGKGAAEWSLGGIADIVKLGGTVDEYVLVSSTTACNTKSNNQTAEA